MSKLVLLDAAGSIQWPPACACCGSVDALTTANATSGRVTSVRPDMALGLSVSSELLNLSYPVCAEHAKGLALANQLTRNTSGFTLLRGLTYFLGALSILLFASSILARLMQFGRPAPRTSTDLPIGLYVLNFAFVFALFCVVWAFKKVPVRVARQTADVVGLKFKSDRYASEFARRNRQALR